MKNTTGLYKHQRDNRGKRRKLPPAEPKAQLVPVTEYEYEKARKRICEPVWGSCKLPAGHTGPHNAYACGDIGESLK